jgi:mono/diheme cytochrome c family protein
LYPPVRNFQQGLYKFGVVKDGGLPHDETLIHILKKGLNGTPMLAWDISDERADAVVQYIKTFAPEIWEGKDKELGEKIVLTKDPYGIAHEVTAVEKGKSVYHFTAQCTSCHRGYVGLEEYNTLAKKSGGQLIKEFDQDFFQTKPQDSEYGAKIIPPDFTWHTVRSARSVEELAYRIAAGVGGVMPSWKEIITDDEIWAVAYYVKHLMNIKDTEEREKFMAELK